MPIEIDARVRELLSDEQIEAVVQGVESGAARCVYCGESIDPDLGDSALVLLVDSSTRRAAARVAHAACGSSEVVPAELPGPGAARLAERWAAFVLPRVPLIVLEARADVWVDEDGPALMAMLRGLGFDRSRELLDSELFATGVGAPPITSGLWAVPSGDDLLLVLGEGTVLESLPGALRADYGPLVAEAGGVAATIGTSLGLPDPGTSGIGFGDLLPALLDRAIGAFVPLRPEGGDPAGTQSA